MKSTPKTTSHPPQAWDEKLCQSISSSNVYKQQNTNLKSQLPKDNKNSNRTILPSIDHSPVTDNYQEDAKDNKLSIDPEMSMPDENVTLTADENSVEYAEDSRQSDKDETVTDYNTEQEYTNEMNHDGRRSRNKTNYVSKVDSHQNSKSTKTRKSKATVNKLMLSKSKLRGRRIHGICVTSKVLKCKGRGKKDEMRMPKLRNSPNPSKADHYQSVSKENGDDITQKEKCVETGSSKTINNGGRGLRDPTTSWIDQMQQEDFTQNHRPNNEFKKDLLDNYYQNAVKAKASSSMKKKNMKLSTNSTKANSGPIATSIRSNEKDRIQGEPYLTTQELKLTLTELEMQALEKGRLWRKELVEGDRDLKSMNYNGE